jgi:glycosyltransferase involved in cell wall biosynthesis
MSDAGQERIVSGPVSSGPSEHKERLAVVIPAYRVEKHIAGVVRGLPGWVDRIIVVDDGSPDGTSDRAAEAGDERLRLLRHAENRGVGAAVRTGLDAAASEGCTIAVKMDGDGQMDPELIGELVRPILEGEADFVKGNRFADPSSIGQMPFFRRAGNLALSFLAKMSTGCWQVFDPTNGFFALDLSVYSRLNVSMLHDRYFFEISLLYALGLEEAVILNVPMPASYGDETSSMSLGRVLLAFPFLLLRQLARRIWYQYFVLGFSVASLFLVSGLFLCGLGAGWGVYAWARSLDSGVPATTGTVMIAVLPLILGFQLLIQTIVFDVTRTPRRPRSRFWRQRSRRAGAEGKDD